MPLLTDPLTLPCGATLPNRLLKSAMTEGLADEQDHATGRLARVYERWSEGGTGTLITGNVMIDRRFLERPGNVVIDHNGGEAQLSHWAMAGQRAGNQLWMQINHPGRQCQKVVSSQPLAPSDVGIKLVGLFGRPRAMTEDDIQRAISGFARVAGVAKATGFSGIQIHAAHGYLISQFLSPLANRRDDDWGGSLENRARFLLTVIRRCRETVGPDFPIALKLNSADFSQGGFSHEDSLQVASWVSDAGIDLLEISGGTYEKLALMGDRDEKLAKASRAREAYFLDYAAGIREVCKVPLAVTGGFRSRSAMQDALDSGALDVIGLARPLCLQPDVRDLLSGEQDAFPSWEKELRIGPGWLGPRSPNRSLRTLNFGLATQWYYQQIIALSEGKTPRPKPGLITPFVRHTVTERRLAKKRVARGS